MRSEAAPPGPAALPAKRRTAVRALEVSKVHDPDARAGGARPRPPAFVQWRVRSVGCAWTARVVSVGVRGAKPCRNTTALRALGRPAACSGPAGQGAVSGWTEGPCGPASPRSDAWRTPPQTGVGAAPERSSFIHYLFMSDNVRAAKERRFGRVSRPARPAQSPRIPPVLRQCSKPPRTGAGQLCAKRDASGRRGAARIPRRAPAMPDDRSFRSGRRAARIAASAAGGYWSPVPGSAEK